MDDAINLLESIRAAVRGVLSGDEPAVADRAIDGGIQAFREHRKLAGTRGRGTRSCGPSTRAAEQMTIKWVKVDPLVMNGEPFLYGTRLTVRQLLELRRNGYTLVELLKDHPAARRRRRGRVHVCR